MAGGTAFKSTKTARDHRDRGTVCKHLLAVSHRYVAQKRDEYKLLADVEKLFNL